MVYCNKSLAFYGVDFTNYTVILHICVYIKREERGEGGCGGGACAWVCVCVFFGSDRLWFYGKTKNIFTYPFLTTPRNIQSKQRPAGNDCMNVSSGIYLIFSYLKSNSWWLYWPELKSNHNHNLNHNLMVIRGGGGGVKKHFEALKSKSSHDFNFV